MSLDNGDRTLVERSHWIPKMHEYKDKEIVGLCRDKRKFNEILFIKCLVQAIPEEKLVWITRK